MTDHKPGTVAKIHDPAYGEQVAMFFSGDLSPACWHFPDQGGNVRCVAADQVTDVRPLVVLDPDDAEQMERVGDAYFAVDGLQLDNEQPMTPRGLAMRHALRSLARPPKPAEPTGLGAVVEDDGHVRWVRHSNSPGSFPWIAEGKGAAGWSEITAVRILSAGVTA